MATTVYLLFGSNTGDRMKYLKAAYEAILIHHRVISCSAIYESAPWGFKAEALFLNMVCCLKTGPDVHSLLNQLLEIEGSLGRVRPGNNSGYASRTIDLDILFYGNAIIDDARLTIPHPLLPERRFALVPMNEIAPGLKHPSNGVTISALLKQCKDNNEVTYYAASL